MKKQIFKTILSAFALVMLCGLFATTATAQNTSVTITVNPKPTIVTTSSTFCPDGTNAAPGITYANGTTPTLEAVVDLTQYVKATNDKDDDITNTTTFFYSGSSVTTSATLTPENSPLTIPVTGYIDTYTACISQSVVLTLTLKSFPGLGIGGTFTPCAKSTSDYTASIDDATSYTWALTPASLGTITNGSTSVATIEWADNKTDAALTGTLSLTYEVDGCIYTVEQEITIAPRPEITLAASPNITACYDNATGTIDIRGSVASVNSPFSINDVIFAIGSATYTYAEAAAIPVDATNGFDNATVTVSLANTTTCPAADEKTFQLTVYPQIEVDLRIVVDNNNSIIYEECANENGSTTQQMTLRLKVTGGCPDAPNYKVTFAATGVTITGGNTLTFTKAAANAGTATITVTVPVDGIAYDISVTKVEQDGTEPCNCSRSTWN